MNDSVGNVLEASHEIENANVKIHYLEFMRRRFLVRKGNFTSKDYAMEWVTRFKNGTPQNHMDNQSKDIYNEVRGMF